MAARGGRIAYSMPLLTGTLRFAHSHFTHILAAALSALSALLHR